MSARRIAVVVTATLLAMLGLLAAKAGKSSSNTTATVVIVTTGQVVTATGPQVVLAHGIVQVQVTLTAGRIIDVTAVQLPHDNPHSWDGAVHAAAVLRTEAIAAQGANINVVSGATYTSRGYARSLQAALDAVNHK